MKTIDEILENTTRCTIDDDADLDNIENFYFKYSDVKNMMKQFGKEIAIKFLKWSDSLESKYPGDKPSFMYNHEKMFKKFKKQNKI